MQNTEMKYYIVDAFTDKAFGGNPAGVVLLPGNACPDETLMLQVAAELRYSETAFVRKVAEREYALRYFTPGAEVELCGHATIATFGLLRWLGLPDGDCLCHTAAGDLRIVVGSHVLMQMATPRIVDGLTAEDAAEAYRAVGANAATLQPQIVYAGLPDIMLPVADLATLHGLQPDMEAVKALTSRLNVVSIHAFVLAGDEFTAHVRDFAPLYDISEESATGTANASLAYYLSRQGLIEGPDCRILQGEAMGRPSTVAVHFGDDGNVYVGGSTAIVAKGKLLL
ncbi:MAG: PhzF family phenazine biosynthesis protein [Bacteroidales bacterium]|nr:PhzF family phenazine biosynthesis protein [Bacteroidales bacterium]